LGFEQPDASSPLFEHAVASVPPTRQPHLPVPRPSRTTEPTHVRREAIEPMRECYILILRVWYDKIQSQ
jgi:hypothetical protein